MVELEAAFSDATVSSSEGARRFFKDPILPPIAPGSSNTEKAKNT